MRMKAFDRLEGKPGLRILDVGCAAGDIGHFLKERESSLQVDGMDVDKASLHLAERKGTYGTVKANLLASEFRYTTTGMLDRTHVRFFSRRTLVQELGLDGFDIADFDFTIRPFFLRHSIMKTPLVLLAAPAILFSRDS